MILTELCITFWYNHQFVQVNRPLPSFIVTGTNQKVVDDFTDLVKVNQQGLVVNKKTIRSFVNILNSPDFWNINLVNQQLGKNVNLSDDRIMSNLRIKESKLCTNISDNVTRKIVSQGDLLNVPSMDLVKLGKTLNVSSINIVNIVRSLENFFNVIRNPIDKKDTYNYQPVLIVKGHENTYQIWVNNSFVATIPDYTTAKYLQKKLEQLISIPDLYTEEIKPGLVNKIPSILIGRRLLFAIEPQISNQLNRNGDILAIEWTNNLRVALNTKPLTLVEGQMAMYRLTPSSTKLTGLASWYGPKFHGKITANGEIYNQQELTVAHRSLPFNTYLKVTNLENNKSVILRVNDRGPYVSPRSLDLSKIAAKCINSNKSGVVAYEATILRPSTEEITFKSFVLDKEDRNSNVF